MKGTGVKRERQWLPAVAAALGVSCWAGAAHAQAGDFYKGKQIRIAIGYAPGGGYDAFGRMVGRHLDANLPGRPTIVVLNMPGAGSQKAVQSLKAQEPDGSYMVLFSPGLILNSILQPDKVRINFRDEVAFVGSATADARVCYAWHDKGVKSLKDLLARKTPFTTGHAGPTEGNYIDAAIVKNLFNAPIKQILGYTGSASQRLAVERGELDGECSSWGSIPRDWIRDGKIHAFVRVSRVAVSEIEDVPFVGDLADAEQKRIIDLLTAHNDMFRPFAVHKNVPQDRLEVLREAFWKTVNGKPFRNEAAKANRPVIEPLKGADLAKLVARLYETPDSLVKKAAAAVK